MIRTYANPNYGEKNNSNTAERCLAKVYLYILEIGIEPEPDYIPDVDDPQDEIAEKSF
jgi:hypothetical protein